MTLIDTHAHLYADDFCADFHEVVVRAENAGVKKILLPNIDETTIAALKKTVSEYPRLFIPMMGLHPTSVRKDWRPQAHTIYAELNEGGYAGVGEIGIDLYWDTALQNEQTAAFEEQLKWSAEKNLPVAIHFRNAANEVIRSIKRVGEGNLRGVFHSFGGNRAELDAILRLPNFCVGINGVATFKNSGLQETLRHCPRNRVLLETDAPYLAPVPFRGKRNESAYLLHVVTKLAEIWELHPEEVAQITTGNALSVFDCDG